MAEGKKIEGFDLSRVHDLIEELKAFTEALANATIDEDAYDSIDDVITAMEEVYAVFNDS